MTPQAHTRSLFPGICLVMLSVVVLLAVSAPGASAITLTSGGSLPTVIARGDPLYIRGIATGQPQVGLQIWFIGTNFAKVTTVPVNNDDTYEYELQPADTAALAAGEYVVVIQHPMMNGRFDVIYDAATGDVINVQTGQTIYRFTGSGSLPSTDAAAALINAISSQNIDDTFTTVSFYVSSPVVTINLIGDKQVGETFAINGSTNLAVGDDLNVQVSSSTFQPAAKTTASGFSGASGMVQVLPGTSTANSWFFYVDTSAFTPGEYIVTVSGVLQDVTATATFNLLNAGSSGGTPGAGPASAATAYQTAALNGTNPQPVSGNLTTTSVTASGTGSNATSGSVSTMASGTGSGTAPGSGSNTISGTGAGTGSGTEPATAPGSSPLPAATTYTPLPAAIGITGLLVALAIRRLR